MDMQEKNLIKLVIFLFFMGSMGFILWISFPFYQLDLGYTAIHLRMGKVYDKQTQGGVYWKLPILDSVIKMRNGILKQSIETSALSKDLQSISIGIDINYRYINEVELYKETRGDAEGTIIVPFCHESIKSVISTYTAEELIHNRHKAKESIYKDLRDRLRPHYIEFVEVNFAHADFSHEFIKAVEDKQIAVQRSMMAKNITESVKESAYQQKLLADAEAYSQEVKKKSITKEITNLKAIEKWDGKLPKIMSGSVPFIDMKDL